MPRTMRSRWTALAVALAAVGAAAPRGAAQPPEPPTIDGAGRQAILDGVVAALEETYVFPEVAAKMEEHVRARLAAGDYDGLTRLPDFTARLTEDLRSVSKDLHIGVGWAPDPPGGAGVDPAAEQARFAEELRRGNYCFEKVEHLAGNVGYLRLDCFAEAGPAGATAVAAMGFLAGSDALIFDLRANGGGSPSMIQLLSSYLFAEPTHLNSFYIRQGDRTEQFWTQAHVAGPRLVDLPVYVLTSGRTFSAAEEFTYNLRNLERATIVGETTGGGAHPVNLERIEGYPVQVSVPFGRAVNPVTGTNWEGTGVEPHVAVPAGEALARAHRMAIEALAEKAEDPERKRQLAWTARMMEDRAKAPGELAAAELAAYAGTYGPRIVEAEGGRLTYRRGEGVRHPLIPVGGDAFLVGELDSFRLRFERDAAGRVVRLVGLYDDGREEPSERSDG
jgi:retinol-binding protein 3